MTFRSILWLLTTVCEGSHLSKFLAQREGMGTKKLDASLIMPSEWQNYDLIQDSVCPGSVSYILLHGLKACSYFSKLDFKSVV